MPASDAPLPGIQQLQRYVSALTNHNQSEITGEQFLRSLGPAQLFGAGSSKVNLFRAFHLQLLRTRYETGIALPEFVGRSAYILTNMEGFSIRETAHILDMPPSDVEKALIRVREAQARKSDHKVLIVEDEPIIAHDLRNMMNEIGIRTTAIASSESGAVTEALKMRPDILLMDVNLGQGGSGIEAVKKIQRNMDIPVVFITAYPEKLLTSDLPEPTYLVAKPFLPETIKGIVRQALLLTSYGLLDLDKLPKFKETAESSAAPHDASVAIDSEFSSQSIHKSESADVTAQNAFQLRVSARYVIAALEDALSYDKDRRHNRPPPEMWIDDAQYIQHLRVIFADVQQLQLKNDDSKTSITEVDKTVISLKENLSTFLRSYADMLGKGAAIATIGLLIILLNNAGVGKGFIQEMMALSKMAD